MLVLNHHNGMIFMQFFIQQYERMLSSKTNSGLIFATKRFKYAKRKIIFLHNKLSIFSILYK